MSSSDLVSKVAGHALQPDEMVACIFLWMGFFSKKGRAPTLTEWKKLWENYNG